MIKYEILFQSGQNKRGKLTWIRKILKEDIKGNFIDKGMKLRKSLLIENRGKQKTQTTH